MTYVEKGGGRDDDVDNFFSMKTSSYTYTEWEVRKRLKSLKNSFKIAHSIILYYLIVLLSYSCVLILPFCFVLLCSCSFRLFFPINSASLAFNQLRSVIMPPRVIEMGMTPSKPRRVTNNSIARRFPARCFRVECIET